MTPQTLKLRPVAALYILERSVYADLPGVDLWPEWRNANFYPGPGPIVAHPPCGAWSRLWNIRRLRRRPGHGDTTGLRAVALVRRFGGVLEQPADSRLWLAGYLPGLGGPDLWGGRLVIVNQSEWGHPSTKPTWLYLCRTGPLPRPPYPGRRGKPLNNCSRRQKFATPLEFAKALVAVARTAAPLEDP